MAYDFVMPPATGPIHRMLEAAINRFIPASHPTDIRAKNRPAQANVKSEIARLMESWTFEDDA